jgi:hypothetical protein
VFDDITPVGIVTTKLLLGRQADQVTPSVVLATITPSGRLLDVSRWDSVLCCEAV